MEEGFYKPPRTLKDMFDVLLEEVDFDERSSRLRTVGFFHSGLSSTLIQLDRPTKRISRISRCETLEINSSVSRFGSTVLPVVLSVWTCYEIVTEVFTIICSNDAVDADDISWFDNCLRRATLPNRPKASTSDETHQKKSKANH